MRHVVAGLHFEIIDHIRVRGEDFPRLDPGAVSEWFTLDVFTAAGQPVTLYPNQQQGNRLVIGWVGREVVPVFDDQGNPAGTKRGADFRTRFWPSVVRRVAKAQLAERLGRRIKDVSEGNIRAAPMALRRNLRGEFARPSLTQHSIDAAVEALTGNPPRQERTIPRGTVANIDADFDSRSYFEAPSYSMSETESTIAVGNNLATSPYRYWRGQTRFPLTALPAGATVNDADAQIRCTSADVDNTLAIYAYDTAGDDDPDVDTATNKWGKSDDGTQYLSGLTWLQSTGSKTGDLGATADADIEANIDSPDRFSLGWVNGETATVSLGRFEALEWVSGTDPATLTVDYSVAAAGVTWAIVI